MNRADHPVRPETAYLVDASIYIFRAWHTLPDQFVDPAGRPTNAVYGFARFLCDLIEKTGAMHVAVAFDESMTSSFRNEICPDYKANRDPTPPALLQQFAWCRDLSRALGLAVYSDGWYEADDLIASLAAGCKSRQQAVCVVSGDKDLAQVLDRGDWWWDFPRRQPMNKNDVFEHFGVYPHQIADFLALAGDSVDNIAGVTGVGPKTAARLLNHFGSLDEIYSRLDEIAWLRFRGSKTLAAKLRKDEPAARLARRLTGLEEQIPELADNASIRRRRHDADALDALLDALGFGRPLRERLHRLAVNQS
ncbi:MAG TPA: 5'-3' exonuclease H3TH domain-containing protein [Wenzhouxiangella sp.]|nr:5'-3' exonuclease H3TH domain-containing protein [Wenzhouxiangella sp.]